jgi:PiT family inorganic phosphate transporter
MLPAQQEPMAKAVRFRSALARKVSLDREQEAKVIAAAELHPMRIDAAALQRIDSKGFSAAQMEAVLALQGKSFQHRWQLAEALAMQSPAWRPLQDIPRNKATNKKLAGQLAYLEKLFQVSS